ncbi:MAG: hypothetical protein OH319_01430 [Candidatus Parvarchaeota archaeon]|nr:hypothetical protein [Candidatus Jingweiarchaeum tengchongense]MCW1297768.1 hypothetical protein [Candidatus Jingweiarchaeum tengchongense]MCW1299778.1 hypothetical protein [Candidatus Jingweiarchaeum tengchongense]MCW1304251.1 hypothetical protein [Candidatus Jingweiarchaeum tengchongense]MCW1305279.1 hypothetical protein [Candidatus Jingweiarchaeum tengchongense]
MNIEDLIFTILISILVGFFIVVLFTKEIEFATTIERIDSEIDAMSFASDLMENLSEFTGVIKKEKIDNLQIETGCNGIIFVDLERNVNWSFGNFSNHSFSLPFLIEESDNTYAAKVIFLVK